MSYLIESAAQLRALTGNYYANNDFQKVQGDIDQAADELGRLIGYAIIAKAEQADEGDRLRLLVQRPVAILACLRLYQKNDLSHEDDGRKFKVSTDGGDKLPWEWQLDRDDAIQLETYYRAVDTLIDYLNEQQPEEWTGSRLYRETQSLIVRNAAEMDRYYPIQRSGRTFLLLAPFLREAQLMTVQDAYGTGWKDLLAEDMDKEETAAHYAACMATCLLAMATALTRLPLKLLPCGVVRGYLAESGMRESEPATLDDVRRASDWMRADAARWIDKMKRARDGEAADYELLPKNCPRNKWCRL